MTPSTMTFGKIKRDRVFEQVSNVIKETDRLGGSSKPGEGLPPENELATEFQREAARPYARPCVFSSCRDTSPSKGAAREAPY